MYISRFIEIFHIDTFYKYIEVKKTAGLCTVPCGFLCSAGKAPAEISGAGLASGSCIHEHYLSLIVLFFIVLFC